MSWVPINKGDARGRELADRHYTRQSVGHPMWTRPGYNYCLLHEDEKGRAVWAWWRPKWEAGQERFDGLRCLECTIFRNESAARSSDLVRGAVAALALPEASAALALPDPTSLLLLTGVSTRKTAEGRSPWHRAGHCFRKAGWRDHDHKPGRADAWLSLDPAPST